jgi:arsenate reductase-like glutaredoxin family protein
MKKVTVYSLKDCNKCRSLLSSLNTNNIQYEIIECYGDSAECDRMEDITDCYNYPVIKIEVSENKEVYLAVDGKLENKSNILPDKSTMFYFFSVDKLLITLIEILK